MPAEEIRVDYAQLEQIAGRFQNAATTVTEVSRGVRQAVDALQESGWHGVGVEAFRAEMSDVIFPALARLVSALEESSTIARQISAQMRAAEEEAATLFRNGGDELPGRDGGGVDISDADIFPEKTSFRGVTLVDGDKDRALSQAEKDWIDKVLDLPWWLDLPLSMIAVGDILDLAREQILKRIKGQEPDILITSLAALGLAADLGWLIPSPGAEDAPNAILATLKTVAKELPAGPVRDYLGEMIERSLKNPEEVARLGKLTTTLAEHADLLPKLMDNPRAFMAVLKGGPETATLLAKHGDVAISAAQQFGEHAPSFIKFYDEIAHIPGADNLLKDMAAGGSTSFGALGELYYFRSIKEEVASIGLFHDGRKAADGVLKDGTVVDVKNWDFSTPAYRTDNHLLRSQLDKLTQQVELRRAQYPNAPRIRYVFTTDSIDDIPLPIRERLHSLKVDIQVIPAGR